MAVQRDNPYANFNFVVIVDGVDEIGFAQVELPAAEIETIDYREGSDRASAARKLPGRVRYGNLVLRRGVSGRLELWQWFDAVRNGQLDRRNVTVTLLDEARNPVQQWRFRDAWPVKFETSDLNAKGNEVVIELLELACDSIDVD